MDTSRMSKRIIIFTSICFALPVLVLLTSMLLGMDGHVVNLDLVLAGSSAEHLLGCDSLGRDVLARLAEGLQLSIFVGVIVVLLGAVLGITIGVLAGCEMGVTLAHH